MSTPAQRADAKRSLRSAHKMNFGGHVVVVGGRGKSHAEQGDDAEDEDEQRGGQHVAHLRLPSKEKEVREESERALKDNRFAILAAESEEVFARWT